KWFKGNPSVSRYWIEFSIDSLFQLTEVDSNITDTSYVWTINEMYNTYYWRVKAYNLSGWGEYSDVWKFRITFTSVDEMNYPDDYVLEQNFPNPFNPSTTIKYFIPSRSKIKISIYDLLGKELLVLVDDEKDRGYHLITLSAKNLPSGTYYYQLEANNNRIIKKMLIVK
ncbi:MAG: T9SS type A sorting domain-containing protein, partial [Ignavibacteria bacterium]|nr:T9SS type A sorting domain-containing protein [Ignavibacteria bacterium]